MTLLRLDKIAASNITPRAVFASRREFLAQAASAAGMLALPLFAGRAHAASEGGQKFAAKPNPNFALMEKQTPFNLATTYNNFYEFGTDKADPAQHAHTLKTQPWTVSIEGAPGTIGKPKTFGIDDLLKLVPLEERIYRLRCVEGWSMVIPWIGFSLSELIKRVEPTGNAKYVEFISLADEKQMPGVRSRVLDWPYVEGLRMDEAMNPLTLLTLGQYGEVLPKQSGAPVRIVTPWKYGFKSGKSIVKIRLVEKEPLTSWHKSAPSEYGFYSNVNPTVSHPRWTQATERRIGEDGFLQAKRKTLMFNGYEAQVGQMYTGMDLKKFF